MAVDISKLDFKLRDELNGYLEELVRDGGSDLHVKSNSVIRKRVNGEMVPVENSRFLSTPEGLTLAKELLRGRFDELVENKSADFIHKLNEDYRFRVNIFFQMDGVSAVFRTIPVKLPALEDLGLPSSVVKLCDTVHRGIVLVTGPTGSGKSTTLASMIDRINKKRKAHIITIEDPVEFVFSAERSIVTQRQLGVDTPSFPEGIKYALRQDPDVILIGEIRDRATMSAALKAAETGHLVLTTMHTNDAIQTINRVLGFYEPKDREYVRKQIAESLRGTIAQRLIPRLDKASRIPACEILVVTPTVKDFIMKDCLEQIYDLVKKGNFNEMISLNLSLFNLYKNGIISKENALYFSDNKIELQQYMRGAFSGTSFTV